MSDSVNRRVAIVTGSVVRSGIGYAIARHLASQGISTAVTDVCRRSVADAAYEAAAWNELTAIADELRQSGVGSLPVRADITDPEGVKLLFESTEQELGPVDILVNNAGVCIPRPLIDTSLAEWEWQMKVNATGTFLCSVRAARRMLELGIKGRIVNISSISGKEGFANYGAYGASKFAVLALTQSLAKELAPHGINVNAVCPGLIDTTMNQRLLVEVAQLRGSSVAEVDAGQLSRIPLARYGSPDDVARVVGFLVSGDSSYMTGQALSIDGGMMMCR